MASMRRLRRRLLRWDRYSAGRYNRPYHFDPDSPYAKIPPGHWRAWNAVRDEFARRDPYAGYGPCFCVGCIGHGRCEHDEPDEHDDAWDDDPVPYVVTEWGLTEAGLL